MTAVTASANPAALRQPITFTATVSVSAPGGGTPTGTVTFFNGPTSLGTRPLALGRATLITSALSLGDHDITVSYGGAASFDGSVSPVLTQTVTRAASRTALTSSRNPAVTGQAVVLTATVAVVAPGAGTPTGTVTFFDGPVALGTVTLNAARQAVLTTSALAVDAHAITASYAGDTNVAPSTSSVVMETINQGRTTTTLTASPNPAKLTQSVTLTARVTVAGAGGRHPDGGRDLLGRHDGAGDGVAERVAAGHAHDERARRRRPSAQGHLRRGPELRREHLDRADGEDHPVTARRAGSGEGSQAQQ